MKMLSKLLATMLTFFMLTTSVFSASVPNLNNAIHPQPSAPIKKALPVLAKADGKKVLALTEKYYKLALSKATAEEKIYLPSIINWKPDFTGNTKNPAKASQYLYSSAYLTTYTDLKGIYLPMTAAVFALDTGNPTAAGNLASAIASYSEDTEKKPLGTAIKSVSEAKSYAADAAAIYEYALALNLAKPFIDIGSMPLLLNYGYICIDTGKLDNAKVIMETANKLSPGYLPAVEGMASYWLAKGDKGKAKKVLQEANMSVMAVKMKKAEEDISEKKLPPVTGNDSVAVMEAKLKNISKVDTVLATDFYENIDPAGAAKARQFVGNLQQKIKYETVNFEYLSQFSTLRAFVSNGGRAAYDAFEAELRAYYDKLAEKETRESEMDMPENSIDSTLDDSGSESEEALTAMLSQTNPELMIFMLMPGNYANPTDLIAQRYNVMQLSRKLHDYGVYLTKQHDELNKVVVDARERLPEKIDPVLEAMDKEFEELDREHKTHNNKSDVCDACVVKTHNIHQKYDTRLNNLIETNWMDVTNFVCSRYAQRIKPNINAMYKDTMRNCLLISDPEIRAKVEKYIGDQVDSILYPVLETASEAYSMNIYDYPYSCSCSEAEVEASRQREQKAYEAYEAQKTAMENRARNAFKTGEIPENSQLYKQLDKYSTSYQLFFMNCKFHPLKTEVSYNLKIPGMETGVTAKMTENHMRNTTTYGGGLTVGIGKKQAAGDALSAAASVSLQGEATFDGKGNMVSADIAGSATGTLTAGLVEVSGSYEASVQRGCKLSGEVSKVYIEDVIGLPEEITTFIPEKPKKTVWKGEYQVRK